ncbi:transcriptional regulator [Mycobacterium sp. KBS0706]|uniref:ATP-binding protein n=1 Tax=Mycobacterium sp. KBS0706 TaxID=2578109 RepID=UPI00110F8D7F|nr:winged helix-turn-helix domain-containing protein [Mycobacterium sp. KBS0706]TSD89731.1 transcriptional regulator [Mycobacterium sp. KBS0706]
MMGPTQAGDVFSFGPFRLAAGERLLTREGAPVDLGARALDILVALVSRPNEPVGKRELMAEVWPDVTVEEGSLRFHIAGLRKALGDGQDGARYITTLPGRGYCFVAPVLRSAPPAQAASFTGATFLPARLARMVGREEEIQALSAQLAAARFVTIVGPGGVGKTTVAAAVAHELLQAFAGAALFVDFGLLTDPRLVPVAVASMLGLPIQSEDPAPRLIAHLRDRRFLLVLDSCEHVIDGAAALAAEIFRTAPEVHILATSREALRVEGEQVRPLAPLASPPEDSGLTAATAGAFPAIRLFLERAAAAGAPLELSDADAALVAEICRRLDGVALAIELAAGRVQAYGLRQTAALLDQRLPLSWPGQRNAPPRQRTLQATLDWSYDLLSEPERLVLRRLAVFVGPFTMEAALGVVTGGAVDDALLFGAIDSLVAKSMVATRPVGAMMRYRLLDTTRAYALQIAGEAGRADLAARHAGYYRRWLEQLGGDWPTLSNAAERGPYLSAMNNVRAALDWCFGPGGDAGLGVALAAAAAPVFLAMSLLTECRRWSERAILALDGDTRGGDDEMHLQAALGMALLVLQGGSDAARTALERGLAIADTRGDALGQLLLLGPLHMFHLRTGTFDSALELGRRGAALAGSVADPAAAALAHFLLGISLHLAGDLGGARAALEAALRHQPGGPRASTIYLGFEGQNLSGAILARTLWLQGHPDQAAEQARRAVREAERMDHPVTLSVAMIWAITVFLWTGDLRSAEQHVAWFTARAGSHSLGPYLAVGQALGGALALRRGDAAAAVEALQDGLAALHEARYEVLTTALEIALTEGLAATGRAVEGLDLVEETIRRVEARGDLVYMPELLRVKGLLLAASQAVGAEACFRQSLDRSRGQGALAWELRAAAGLAALLAGQGRSGEAAALLRPVFDRFTEGAETADLQAAARLLAMLEA